jgi:hypothetical protein
VSARPRRTVLIASGADRAWERQGLCRDDQRFADGPFGRSTESVVLAQQLAHRCRAHCSVIEQCAAKVISEAPMRPRQAVRAGVFFGDNGRPELLDDSRCGSHCAGLPWVHR